MVHGGVFEAGGIAKEVIWWIAHIFCNVGAINRRTCAQRDTGIDWTQCLVTGYVHKRVQMRIQRQDLHPKQSGYYGM